MFRKIRSWINPKHKKGKNTPKESDKVEDQVSLDKIKELLESTDVKNWELAFTLLKGQSLGFNPELYKLICSDIGRLTICVETEHLDLLRPFKYLHIHGFKADNAQYRNRFSNALSKLTHLEELYWIGRNFLFSSDYIDAIPKLQNLKRLRLTQLYFKELEMAICELPLLEELNLSQNHIDNLPKEFAQLSHLRVLNLDYCYFKTIPAAVFQLRQLESLSMEGNPMVHLDIKSFSGMAQLKKLRLPKNIAIKYLDALKAQLPKNIFEAEHWKNLEGA